ncbi:hypothetical protein PT974_12169 [Cladobotryum mycophilum]|uniref:Uncharacterized protein n=1 Tax=Cladobotryum mycophilum TaxID=491253 RepID=A0ABR0S7D0_9HYPO
MTESTPLLHPKAEQTIHPPKLYTLPYALRFIGCFLCNLLPLILKYSLTPADSWSNILARFAILVLPDYLQDFIWAPLNRVLDYAAFEAIIGQPDPSDRETIRKSDSLNVVMKGVALKLPAIVISIAITLRQGDTGFCVSFLAALVCPVVMGGAAFLILLPLAEEVQSAKKARDRAVEESAPELRQLQQRYANRARGRERLRSAWKVILLGGRLVLCAPSLTIHNLPMYIRLIIQVNSTDEAFDKMVQGLPKARPIIAMMRQRGIMHYAFVACQKEWLE